MDAIRDRIRGALYGLAVGNALGLRVDGLSRTEIERRYPRWFMVFDELDPDGRLIPGSWTSKTEHALRRLDELVATGYDRVDVLDCGDEATTRRP
ncbi:MAG: ADP-ribosylglycohydrolase family protein, partial [Planctomycetes bacterium]|nr:ADP-ribosylglycohydrolase family protein [Planctomycetota bacterium]